MATSLGKTGAGSLVVCRKRDYLSASFDPLSGVLSSEFSNPLVVLWCGDPLRSAFSFSVSVFSTDDGAFGILSIRLVALVLGTDLFFSRIALWGGFLFGIVWFFRRYAPRAAGFLVAYFFAMETFKSPLEPSIGTELVRHPFCPAERFFSSCGIPPGRHERSPFFWGSFSHAALSFSVPVVSSLGW